MIFILLTKLSPEISKQMKDCARLGRVCLDQVYEAPDEETAAKVSMISKSNGAFVAQSFLAKTI